MQFQDIKTPGQLAQFVDGPFFSRDTMRFFGDTMSNYAICHHNKDGTGHYVELYRKRPVKHGLQASAYFQLIPGSTSEAKRIFIKQTEG